jgi:hypothetical protein
MYARGTTSQAWAARSFRARIRPLESLSCVNLRHISAAEFFDTNTFGIADSGWNSVRTPIFIREDELKASGEKTSHGARGTMTNRSRLRVYTDQRHRCKDIVW